MTKIELRIIGYDFSSSKPYVVSLSNCEIDIPRAIINKDRQHVQVIQEIITDLVNIEIDFVDWKCKSVIYSDDDVILVFECEIPYNTQLKDAYWMKYV